MKVLCYSVRDEATQAFLPPFYARHIGEAVRSFSDAVLDTSHQFHKHRSDYVLYEVGAFDDVAGGLSGKEPQRVVGALEIIARDE